MRAEPSDVWTAS